MADNPPKPGVPLADKGYVSDSSGKNMKACSAITRTWMRKSHKMPAGVDPSLSSLHNPVRRFFNKLKKTRRVATHWNETAKSFLGSADMMSESASCQHHL